MESEDLGAVRSAVNSATSPEQVLHILNENGWVLVRSSDIGGYQFTDEQLDIIRIMAIARRDEYTEEIRLRYGEGSYGELCGPSRQVGITESILEKIGYQ